MAETPLQKNGAPEPLPSSLAAEFHGRFGTRPSLLVRAPGRVNLIGEHTDYNEGFVLPLAIDRSVWIALSPREDSRVKLYSQDFGEEGEFELGLLEKGPQGWLEYAKGTAWALLELGLPLRGFDGVLGGDVPVGAGLSSSAALELALARAFISSSGLPWDAVPMAKAGQRAENGWVGLNCGIMDQLIAAAGEEGHSLLIDCRSLETRPVPIPRGLLVAVLDTSTRRGLVASAYNERREECDLAARRLGTPALRDATVGALAAHAGELAPRAYRRARHVVTENARTVLAAAALARGEAALVGGLMDESHTSLRDDFEVSSPALDAIVDVARAHHACLGARMTGAGFGGCAVALVLEGDAAPFATDVTAAFRSRTGLEAKVYFCRPSEGASVSPAPS